MINWIKIPDYLVEAAVAGTWGCVGRGCAGGGRVRAGTGGHGWTGGWTCEGPGEECRAGGGAGTVSAGDCWTGARRDSALSAGGETASSYCSAAGPASAGSAWSESARGSGNSVAVGSDWRLGGSWSVGVLFGLRLTQDVGDEDFVETGYETDIWMKRVHVDEFE